MFKSLILAGVAVAGAVGLAHAAPVGTTVDAATMVTGTGAGGTREITRGSSIFSDDRIRADRSGNAQLLLSDNTKVVVGPGAGVSIDEFVVSSSRSFQSLTLSAAKGAFRFISGNSSSSAYKINTASGTIGVRGTAFDTTVIGGETHVTVVSGSVELCPRNGACTLLSGVCAYGVMTPNGVSLEGDLREKSDADRNRFPLMANQRPLQVAFRHEGPNCTLVPPRRDSDADGVPSGPEPTPPTIER